MISSTAPTSLVIVDPTVQDYQQLVSSVSAETAIAVLDATQDGLTQITDLLAHSPTLNSIHILSHGSAGSLHLGSSLLGLDQLERHADQVQGWAAALAQDAAILLYGCDVAQGDDGAAFVQRLSTLTGVPVAASTDLTGSADLGGDWDLEFTTGDIHTPLAFASDAMAAYGGVLAETLFLNETFSGDDVLDNTAWSFGTGDGVQSARPFLTARNSVNPSQVGGLPGNPGTPDPDGSGVLRLTNASQEEATFVLYNKAIPATSGLSITFDLISYGGTGADGVTFMLIDGATSPTKAGGFGGSIGYAQRDEAPGIVGGYLGIAFDEFGNFSNPTEGRTAGDAGTPNQGFLRDAIAIRGSQANAYKFLRGTGTLPFSIDNISPTATRENSATRVQINLSQTGILSVSIDGNRNGVFDPGEEVINDFDISVGNGEVPDTFKFGFAGGTGAFTNIHEVRTLSIKALTEPPVAADVNVSLQAGETATLPALSATDPDGTIVSFTVLTIPPANQGVLQLRNPDGSTTPVAAGQELTPVQVSQLVFQAGPNFTGTTFTYTATDNFGAIDATPAVVGLNRPGAPNTDNVAVKLPQNSVKQFALSGSDPDGSIVNYTILTIPPTSEGTLFLGDPSQGGKAVTAGQVLTPDQVNQLFFQSSATFGTSNFNQGSTSFTYTATDNTGLTDLTPGQVKISLDSGVLPVGGDCLPGKTLRGTAKDNRLNGGVNADTLRGKRGNDRLKGRGCDDILRGDAGNDALYGNDGQDLIRGNTGDDLVKGNFGDDFLRGGLGRDRISGGRGLDTLSGGRNADVLDGGRNADVLNGGWGDDVLKGRGASDTLRGRQGQDVLRGGSQRDFIFGGLRADDIKGGGGADTIVGGKGSDTLIGNGGRDRFVYTRANQGLDTILDFIVKDDFIDLSAIVNRSGYGSANAFSAYVKLTVSGGNTIVEVDANGDSAGGFTQLATLSGIKASTLKASNFIL